MMQKEIIITDFSKKGDGVAFLEDRTPIEVPHVFPEDQVLVKLNKKRKGKIKGRMQELLLKSSLRTCAKCEHARICGGCIWQEMQYEKQLQQKEKWMAKIFKSIQKDAAVYPIVASQELFYYRNKMEFSFSENGAGTRFLGLMIVRAQSYVFNISTCHLASLWFSSVLQKVRQWWEKENISAYSPRNNSGILRTLTLREGKRTKEKMVVLTTAEKLLDPMLRTFVESIQEAVDGPVSVYLRVQHARPKMVTTFQQFLLHGKPFIKEQLCIEYPDGKKTFSFLISPTSFFQPNTYMAEKLFSLAIAYLPYKTFDLVYDLYCGTGSIGMIFSPLAKEVIGIELNEEAVQDGQKNIELNHISNYSILAGDVGKLLLSMPKKYPDLVIVDPPRSGLDPLALHQIKILRPKIIVYISCNPYTQKENIEELIQCGYRLQVLQPVDQFPHTPHMENIAILFLT